MRADAPVVTEWLRRHPACLIHDFTGPAGKSRSFEEALGHARAAAAKLRAAGVQSGDRIGVIGRNSYAYLVLDVALLSLNAIPVAIPTELAATYGVAEFERLGLKGLVVEELLLAGTLEQNSAGGWSWIKTLEDLVVVDGRIPEASDATGDVCAPVSDVFVVVFSSGSTGRPRRLPIRWASLVASISRMAQAYGVGPGDSILVALPLSSMQQKTLCYLAFRSGADIVLTTEGRLPSALKKGNPSIVLGPPAFLEMWESQYQRLSVLRRWLDRFCAALSGILPRPLGSIASSCAHRTLREVFGRRVRLMLVGSAPLRPSLLQECGRLRWPLYQLYGANEAGWIGWNTPEDNRQGSVGRAAFPGTVSLSADGEVLVTRSWNLADRYEDDPDAGQSFLPEGCFRTGDLGQFDAEGYLYITGRVKNVITTSGGQKLPVEEIEKKISEGLGGPAVAAFQSRPGDLIIVVWPTVSGASNSKLLASRLRQMNTAVLYSTPVNALALAEEPCSVNNGLLSPNGKLDRRAVRERFEGRAIPLTDLIAS